MILFILSGLQNKLVLNNFLKYKNMTFSACFCMVSQIYRSKIRLIHGLEQH
jgi:hypothetical protein